MIRTISYRVIASLAIVGASIFLLSNAAFAQQATASPAANDQSGSTGAELEKITVTGYVVPRVGDGPAPVTTLDAAYADRRGSQTVSDLIATIPQNVNAFTPTVNAGNSFAPAASAVNLRGLGVNSTLVLIDGRRQVVFPFAQSGTDNFVDLNSIPLAAVDRVEILRDGASATYGSDAIAGVVNFILKDEYNGGDIKATYGVSQRGDYANYHGEAVAGISKRLSETSKFSLLASFDYFESDPIKSADRGFAANPDHSKNGYNNNLSFSSPLLNVVDPNGNFLQQTGGFAGNPTANDFAPQSTNFFNFANYTNLISREQRYGAFFKVKYEPTNFLQFYDEFSYNYSEEIGQAAPSPISLSDGIIIPADNPFNPFGGDASPLYRPLQDGARKIDTTIETVRNVGGIRLFNLPKNWFADAGYLFAESTGAQNQSNFLSVSKVQAALNGTLAGHEGVFFNPFVNNFQFSNATNGELLNASKISPFSDARTNLQIFDFKAGGELFDLPGGPITLGFGAEYRTDQIVQISDRDTVLGDVIGLGASNANGQRYVRSAYYELTIPILGQKWSWPGARSLEFVIAQRYDDYSDFGSAGKPKFQVLYKPFDDLTLRGSYSEGFRAPSLSQLFTGANVSFLNLVDTVTGPGEFELRSGGNPDLKPESSYSYYLGGVWAPGSKDPEHSWWGWANGFTAYLDYYNIERRNEVNSVDPQFILDHENLFPGAVVRNIAQQIIFINDPFQNIGVTKVDGIDFGFSYASKEFAWGKIYTEFNGSYIHNHSIQPLPGQNFEQLVNTYAYPAFKADFQLFYSKTLFGIDMFQTGFTVNYIDSEGDNAPKPNGDNHTVGSWTTVDWQISYSLGKPEEPAEAPAPGYSKDGKRVIGEKAISPVATAKSNGIRKWIANTTLTFGINNLFDVRPPFSDVVEGYDTATTNAIQRFYYVSLEKKF
jgi:iron complex outermembrane receptor protein